MMGFSFSTETGHLLRGSAGLAGLLRRRKWTVTAILVGVAALILLYYLYCIDVTNSACQYLKGSIFGVDLLYLGLLYLAGILLLTLLQKDRLCLVLLSLGLGGEFFLVGYQVYYSIYCPYCLAFGAIVLILFALHFERREMRLIAPSLCAGFLFFFFTFSGTVTPSYGEERGLTTFGSGPTAVRLYTDYFCGPCQASEPQIEQLLTDLIAKKAIRVTFIDTPVHRETILYATYFLFLLRHTPTFAQALRARGVLYAAAEQKIHSSQKLEDFLVSKGMAFQSFDVTPLFRSFERHIKEDRINATPSCVIISKNKKELLVGRADITEGLKRIAPPGKRK